MTQPQPDPGTVAILKRLDGVATRLELLESRSPTPPELLTERECKWFYGIKRTRLWRLASTNGRAAPVIRRVKQGGQTMFRREDIERFLEGEPVPVTDNRGRRGKEGG